MRRLLALLTLTATLLTSSVAAAQEELDLEPTDRAAARKTTKREVESEVVREIVRGTYIKANAGTTMYLLNRRGILRGGTTLNLAVGRDFIDKPTFSVAGELQFYQALHNGMPFQEQGALGLGPNRLIEGDVHTFGVLLGAEVSAYPVRRLGIGGRLGAGAMFIPILMDRSAYDEEVVGLSQGTGEWGGPQNDPRVHRGAKPMFYVGPTIEYYTKLSHFSLGLDVDLIYALDLDLGLALTGYFKYTF
jgi:hypothetical protein